ncbi:MAG TPA: tetratricopeptide repeat protein [Candidatus Eisenbacteria bacterium]|jgi:serine/threonine-protein kinase
MHCPRCTRPVALDAENCPSCGAALTDTLEAASPTAGERASPLELEPGSAFAGRFTIIERVAQGGMGVVYKAIDQVLDQEVALKLIHPALARIPEFVERFKREVRVTHQISHPNVCRVHDLGECDGVPYISMQWIHGQTLQQLLSQAGRLDTGRGLEIAEKIAGALEAAHAEEVVHRDLKPGNVMIDEAGEVHVMDFGLAVERGGRDLSEPGIPHGTPLYMAPEQLRGDPVDVRADLYALGLVLREMLTGRRPEPGLPASDPLRSQVSRSVVPVLEKLLASDREQRYGSAHEVAQVISSLRGAALPAPPGPPRRSLLASRPRLVLALAALATAGVLAAVWWSLRPPSPSDARTYHDRGMYYLHEEADTRTSLDNAVQMFHRAVIADSTWPPAWAGLGEAYWARFERVKDPASAEEAKRAVARALSLDRANAEARNAEARGFISQGKYREARQELQEVVSQEPRFDMAWANLGRAHRGLEQYADGLKAFETAIKLRPDRFLHHIYLGNFYQQFGEHDEAEKAYRRAIDLKPESPIAWSNLGASLLFQGQSEKAVPALLRSLEIEETAAARSNLGTAYYQLKQYEEAALAYRRAMELEPTVATHCGNLGDALRMLGREEGARAAYGEAVRRARARALITPLKPASRASLALWCAHAGDKPCALEEARAAAAMQPKDINILFCNAQVRCIFGDDDGALGWLEKAVSLGLGKAEIESDPDLARLRSLPRFQRILGLAS